MFETLNNNNNNNNKIVPSNRSEDVINRNTAVTKVFKTRITHSDSTFLQTAPDIQRSIALDKGFLTSHIRHYAELVLK